MPESRNLLEIEGLRVRFRTEGGEVTAVDDVSLTVRPHETLALVGESGSGKSVTALAIMRLLPAPPQCTIEGRVTLAGRELLGLPETQMRAVRGNDIAMIFQEPMTSLNPVHTGGRPDRRGDRLPSQHRPPGGAGTGRPSCWTSSASPTRASAFRLSPPDVRRHAPARDDRHGARLRALAADRRRTHHRPRRHRPGADPGAA